MFTACVNLVNQKVLESTCITMAAFNPIPVVLFYIAIANALVLDICLSWILIQIAF